MKTKVYHESEHQELFCLQTDMATPLALHVPSALGPLAYFACVRVPQERARAFTNVSISAKLTGLHSTDTTAKPGEGVDFPNTLPSKVPGLVWVFLTRIRMARGDGFVTFSGMPEGIGPVDILFCTWPRFVGSGQADDWIALRSDPRWAPSGVPLGGIGCGRIDFCRDGKFRNFSGNNNQDMPFEDPDGIAGAYLEVESGGKAKRLSAGTYTPAFPQASLDSKEILPGVDAKALLSGPIVPHDLRLSSLPVVLVRWEIRNRSDKPVDVTCRLGWPNLVGMGGGLGESEKRTGYGDGFYRYWEAPSAPSSQRTTLATKGKRTLGVLKYSNAPSDICASADGHHYVAVEGGTAEDGRVSTTLHIAPQGTATANMALVWDMPHWVDVFGTDRGHYWQNHFKDGADILNVVFDEFDDILEKAGALGSLLNQTDLPEWIRLRLLNSCYPLVSNSVFYRDGRFSINEGPTEMAGCYGTIDQRLGSHPATQLLFPALNRKELELFTAVQAEDGGINHDLGGGHLENTSRPQAWPDIPCSYVIQCARHAWTTGDKDFATAMWPKAKLALERHGRWADEGKGVAQLGRRTRLGTSYDSYHYEGTTAYIATLWIAALHIGTEWARRVGDTEFEPKAQRWLAAAQERMDADLWNGSFYRAYAGEGAQINENLHGGTLAGEFYARMLAGKSVLPEERLRANCTALMALQGNPKFVVPPDEVSPDGGVGSLYGWLPYIEAFCIAPLAITKTAGAMGVWERMVRAMSGGDLHPCDTRLMYRPQTGELSWGAYYMTAPASWLVYDAFTGFHFDTVTGEFRLDPQFEGKFAVVHPCFWGIAERKKDGTVSLKVTHRFTDKVKIPE